MPFENFNRVHLHPFPTPLHEIPRFGQSIDVPNLYIKRDDHMLLGLGGNKIRNLEYWLGEAVQQHADIVIAAGGLQSNQCRLTAAACAKLGLPCVLVHNDNPPDLLEGNMLLNHLLGARSIFIGKKSEEERATKTKLIEEQLRNEGHNPYVIGEPGLGALGYAQAAEELILQSQQMGISLDHIVIVGAMCITSTGLLYGISLQNTPVQVHVISVEYPLQTMLTKTAEVWQAILKRTHWEPGKQYRDFAQFHDMCLGQGYGIPSRAANETVKLLAQTEGIFIEQVYSAKTFLGLIELRKQGIIQKEDKVCIFHTGGYGALFAQGPILVE